MDDGGQLEVGIAQSVQQPLDAAKRQIDELGMQQFQRCQKVVAR